MNEDKMKKIYEKTIINSVGREKKCSYKKNIKNSINKIAIETLVLVFIVSSLIGCQGEIIVNNDINGLNTSETYTITEENNYDAYEIHRYETNRIYNLLEKYGYTDFIINGTKKHYNYTSEDFKKIKELDETYLYGFYVVSDRETLDKVCEALGYEDIKDYLIKNNYVNSKNEASVTVWYDSNLVNIQKIMCEEGIQRSR